MKKETTPPLDVNFIGDQEEPITEAEFKLISDYFQKKKSTKRPNNKNNVGVIHPVAA